VAENLTTSKVTREVAAQLLDASTTGLGLRMAPAEVRWAKVGALVCIHAEVTRDWVVGIIRRARATEQILTVGVEIICHRPQVAWLRVVSNERELVWQDAVKQERNFDAHFVRAILLADPPARSGASSEMVLPINRAKPGIGLDLPMANHVVRLRVREVNNSSEDYARVRVEWVQAHALPAAQPPAKNAPEPAEPDTIHIDIPPLELD
jgi:hypothetical protein